MPPRTVAVTLDVDWAPDFVIDHVASLLLRSRVRATWFLTHESPAIDRLRDHEDLFELGIHPNFLPGSSQGSTLSEVLRYCMRLAPNAVSMRTHSLAQSARMLAQVLDESPIELDASFYLPRQTGLHPTVWWLGERPLLRVAHWWEDDIELIHPEPVWDLERATQEASGLVVYDFHPIHVYLNSATLAAYNAMKQSGGLAAATPESTMPFVAGGIGAGTAFDSLLSYLSQNGGGVRLDQVLAAHHAGTSVEVSA